jgi:hypothetical protein
MDHLYQPNKHHVFSPLALYFHDHGYPAERKGKKTMIGQNGWLEITERSGGYNKQTSPKKTSILDGIRKIAKDMVSYHLDCMSKR